MKRSDRLMALVLHLRVREWVRAEALGREFGVGVRTIYRDVAALNAAGVPVLSAPGQGYRLMDGYFLPPLHFTPQEAVMLAFGLEAVQGAFGAEDAGAAQEAARKLGAALPEERRAEVERLRAHVRLIGPDAAEHAPALPALRAAILAGRSVRFRYHAPGGVSGRHADPLALVRMNGVWMLTAHDHARGERRTFRLDRMEELVTGEAAIHPAPPGLRQPPGERRGLQVELLFAPGMERWVRERPSFYQVAEHSGEDGYRLTFQVRSVDDLLPWVLSWGASVRVLEPPELAGRLRAEARALLAAHP